MLRAALPNCPPSPAAPRTLLRCWLFPHVAYTFLSLYAHIFTQSPFSCCSISPSSSASASSLGPVPLAFAGGLMPQSTRKFGSATCSRAAARVPARTLHPSVMKAGQSADGDITGTILRLDTELRCCLHVTYTVHHSQIYGCISDYFGIDVVLEYMFKVQPTGAWSSKHTGLMCMCL